MKDRFAVSSPLLLAAGFVAWAVLWGAIYRSVGSGGWRPRHGPELPGMIAMFLIYGLCALIGPLTVFKFSSVLEVDGTTLSFKRLFGLHTTIFQRSEIQSANLIRKGRERLLELRLANGSRIEINRFSRNFGRLLSYLGVAE